LDGITKLSVHYAIESIIASHPGELSASKEIGCDPSLIDKCAVEFLDGYLAGNWKAFLTLLYDRTEVALDLLVESMRLHGEERDDILRRLAEETAGLKGASHATHVVSGSTSASIPIVFPSDYDSGLLTGSVPADADTDAVGSSETGFKADAPVSSGLAAEAVIADAEGDL
jgi:hypothetical protein